MLTAKFTRTDADLIFAKVKGKGARKITFSQFEKALEEVAKRKGVETSEIISAVQSSTGPQYRGTQADSVKWHDDKSLYTGVYAHGGTLE